MKSKDPDDLVSATSSETTRPTDHPLVFGGARAIDPETAESMAAELKRAREEANRGAYLVASGVAVDVVVSDERETEEECKGSITKWEVRSGWLNTGYCVNIRMAGLQPIIDEMISKEVLGRLKG